MENLKVGEVRIGNYVWIAYPDGLSLKTKTKCKELFRVVSINENDSLNLIGVEYPLTKIINCSFSEPVILSEDTILDAGFEKFKTIGGHFFYNKIGIRIDYILGHFKILGYNRYYLYLHEIQNLVAILTNTELTIKL